MANTYVTIAGTIWHPETPHDRERFWVGAQKRMASGQLRRAVDATKWRIPTYVSEELTEAQLATLRAAITFTGSFTFTDELGTSRTVVLNSWSERIARVVAAVEGATTGTGAIFYVVTIELEEV